MTFEGPTGALIVMLRFPMNDSKTMRNTDAGLHLRKIWPRTFKADLDQKQRGRAEADGWLRRNLEAVEMS